MFEIPHIGAPFRINLPPVALHAATTVPSIPETPYRPRLKKAKSPRARDLSAANPLNSSSGQAEVYFSHLTKMIPTEALALYVSGKGLVAQWPGIWAGICLAVVVLFRIVGTNSPGKKNPIQWWAVLIAAFSFILWVYAMGDYIFPIPFLRDNPSIISAFIFTWTTVMPKLYKGD